MKAFGLYLNFLATFCMLVASTTSQAASTRSMIDNLNYLANVEFAEQALKNQFTTKEDHREITYQFIKTKKLADKWIWRFEPYKQGIAFRLNGRVQFVMEKNPTTGTLAVNGQPFKFKQGQSVKAFEAELQKLIAKPYASVFDSLFMDQAEAIPPFWFIAAAFVMVAVALGSSSSSAQAGTRSCTTNPKTNSKFYALAQNSRPNARACRNGQSPPKWCTNTRERVKLVAKNYKQICRGRSGCQNFANFEACIAKKTKTGPNDWGLSNDQAMAICYAALESIDCPEPFCGMGAETKPFGCEAGRQKCCPGTATPPPTTNVTPVACPKTGTSEVAVARQKELCNSCQGNTDCCRRAGIDCTAPPEPAYPVTPVACPKTGTSRAAKDRQRSLCNSCYGNLDCCARAGVSCSGDTDNPLPASFNP